MDEKTIKIRNEIRKKLSVHRFEHTLGVTYTCQALAMRYGYDLRKAELAGLLHDNAKRFDAETMLKKCMKREIPITESEQAEPSLLHAKLGAWYAREKFGVEDEEILSAIACHTTGKPNMSLLDKILYVADYIEPERNHVSNLAELRQLAFVDLDRACLAMMEGTLSYLKSTGSVIDTMTIAACVDMRQKLSGAGSTMPEPGEKEESTGESVQRNRKTRSRSTGREKRRRY